MNHERQPFAFCLELYSAIQLEMVQYQLKIRGFIQVFKATGFYKRAKRFELS